MDSNTFIKALNSKDSSGFTLRDLINNFLYFLEYRCEKTERENYINALKSIQPGGIRGEDVMNSFLDGEMERHESKTTIANVRLVNGSTKQETRQKLMLTFNTPFYPDILIASSVMAEGVDLHLNCRYIIHHDLCWNPSTLEQRTGRIDRIGAKSEKCLEPIHVYIPFIAETQDEKMYRVVMDRERWFKVVMGENYSLDAKTTEKLSERIPIPLSLAEELSFKLGVAI
jgi:superfamily II DNA or RNA helicase